MFYLRFCWVDSQVHALSPDDTCNKQRNLVGKRKSSQGQHIKLSKCTLSIGHYPQLKPTFNINPKLFRD